MTLGVKAVRAAGLWPALMRNGKATFQLEVREIKISLAPRPSSQTPGRGKGSLDSTLKGPERSPSMCTAPWPPIDTQGRMQGWPGAPSPHAAP